MTTLERLGYQLDKAGRTPHRGLLPRPDKPRLHAEPTGLLLAAGPGRPDAARGRCSTRRWTAISPTSNGGTTREGIHLGAMAGTVDLLLRCYTGLETRDGKLWLHPALPTELGQVRFQISYRNHGISRGSDTDSHGAAAAGQSCPANPCLCGRQDDHHACGPHLPVHARHLRQRMALAHALNPRKAAPQSVP